MKKIVYKTETGIAIIHPVKSVELAMKDIPEGVEYKIVDESEIPSDRTFRGSWDFNFKEDIVKVKEIKKNILRSERKKLFSANDIKLQNAIADCNEVSKAEAVTERNRLRDIPKIVDSCKTISDIKTITCNI